MFILPIVFSPVTPVSNIDFNSDINTEMMLLSDVLDCQPLKPLAEDVFVRSSERTHD